MAKTWKLTVTEEELRAIISYNTNRLAHDPTIERSARIHELTKKLNKNDPEIESDPRPTEDAALSNETKINTSGW